MKAWVIYESMYGNTRDVAKAIAEGLSSRFDVTAFEVGTAPATVPGDLTLLVVGGPTHAFGMTRASTRESAAQQAPDGLVSSGIGVREWLEALPRGAAAAAAFDTRVSHPKVLGSAAHAIHRRLRKLGYRMATDAETFWVGGSPGPLDEGELDRATAWGERLAIVVGGALAGAH